MKTRLVKHTVCRNCLSVGITDKDCICIYSNEYPTITLEFEECECCGHILNDGCPADTEFNKQQANNETNNKQNNP